MPVTSPTSLEELRNQVLDHGGVITLGMASVRDAYGAKRLGPQICQNISDKLRGLGIGHVGEIPEHRTHDVRFFHIGSPVGRLIEAVMHPGEANDDRIREIAAGDEADTLDRIRELVCD